MESTAALCHVRPGLSVSCRSRIRRKSGVSATGPKSHDLGCASDVPAVSILAAFAVAFCATAFGQDAVELAQLQRLEKLSSFPLRATNREVPLMVSVDPNQARLISGKLAKLAAKGAACGTSMYQVNQEAVDSELDKSTPFAERHQLRMLPLLQFLLHRLCRGRSFEALEYDPAESAGRLERRRRDRSIGTIVREREPGESLDSTAQVLSRRGCRWFRLGHVFRHCLPQPGARPDVLQRGIHGRTLRRQDHSRGAGGEET